MSEYPTSSIEVPVRYGREITAPGLRSHEKNLRYGELRWRLPASETALVLVDCWDYFPLESFVKRAAKICRTKIRPVLEASRETGIAVVHAPSPEWAANYPDFLYAPKVMPKDTRAPDSKMAPVRAAPAVDWPPESLTKDGEFSVPRAGSEPVYKEWWDKAYPDRLKISSYVEPSGNDIVVSTGDELHAFCRERRIKHLVYAGFATNICVLYRGYGVRSMRQRGYNIILIRDATTAVESSETVKGRWATRAAIFYVEIKTGVTTTAGRFENACRNVSAEGGHKL